MPHTATTTEKRAEKAAELYRIHPAIYTTVEDIAAKEKLDGVIITVPDCFPHEYAVQKDFPHLSLIDMKEAMGSDFEGTIDGIHPDELGMWRFASFLIRELRKIRKNSI